MIIIGPKIELTLRRKSRTSDGMGGYAVVEYGLMRITGSITRLSIAEQTRMGKETVYATHRFVCAFPAGVTVTEADTMTDDAAGRRFGIKAVNDVMAQGRQLELDLLEVT